MNAEYHDPSFIRNRLSFHFFEQIGVLAPAASHVFLYINEKKEGIYLKIESVDDHFLKRRNLERGAIYYAVDDDANFSLLSSFNKKAKQNLMQGYEEKRVQAATMTTSRSLSTLSIPPKTTYLKKKSKRYLDVKQYLLWLIGAVYTQNFDGFVHNYALYLNGRTKTFQIIPWDYDATWGRNIHGEEWSTTGFRRKAIIRCLQGCSTSRLFNPNTLFNEKCLAPPIYNQPAFAVCGKLARDNRAFS
ncbi:CotH [Bacillus licheniformis]|nr:CotH [Bacillus licheniformis]